MLQAAVCNTPEMLSVLRHRVQMLHAAVEGCVKEEESTWSLSWPQRPGQLLYRHSDKQTAPVSQQHMMQHDMFTF